MDDLTDQMNELNITDYGEVRQQLIEAGYPNPSRRLVDRTIKRFQTHRCLVCPFHAEDLRGLKQHLRENERCRYGQQRLREEKDALAKRVSLRLGNTYRFAELHSLPLTNAEKDTRYAIILIHCLLIRLK